MLLATFTISLRRSSVSWGITTRMMLPSLVGLTPRSELRIAVSIAFSCEASYGLTMTMRASGTLMLAICVIGVGAP